MIRRHSCRSYGSQWAETRRLRYLFGLICRAAALCHRSGNWFQFGAISLVDVSLSIYQKFDKIPLDIMLVAR